MAGVQLSCGLRVGCWLRHGADCGSAAGRGVWAASHGPRASGLGPSERQYFGKDCVMQTGVSVYFSAGMERNEQIIARARQAGATMAFTSMHIPEEEGVDYGRDARNLL